MDKKASIAIIFFVFIFTVVLYLLQFRVIPDGEWQWYTLFVSRTAGRFFMSTVVLIMFRKHQVNLLCLGLCMIFGYEFVAEVLNYNVHGDLTVSLKGFVYVIASFLAITTVYRLLNPKPKSDE